MTEIKKYYLPKSSAFLTGSVFIIIGLFLIAIDFIFDDVKDLTLPIIFKRLFINFDDFSTIVGSTLMLLLRVAFIGYGIYIIKKQSQLTVFEIDARVIRYREAVKSRYDIFHFINPLKSVYYKELDRIYIADSSPYKNVLMIEVKGKQELLLGVHRLNINDKKEIVRIISQKITNKKRP
ncbi:hypothetical protein BAX94_04355 [Elizabethkingia meningoseptica]|uniref:DUF304 domain-containing protein n=1 Tax=Elizabethkingia meningoseptica TaxID=238 RepID=A0A1V3U302_ELIME|nr:MULTISPECIES: hypothetical protein [Elizabethkingia]AQX14004.1 hypothetical protein BBD35_17210 [Elizabethkingia meningoseptica]MBG0515820.1 hypothetical protein [Elizabethkingia meningoseptica]MDE5433813.1 hypothetical protein [Elizabethkingia meningoseptica]MDE5447843.1 hypothetical protein [Elizabethkingia meningoseptica]MDE5449948.1 hypothetical protein [Elizabethkingia meningoseptica]